MADWRWLLRHARRFLRRNRWWLIGWAVYAVVLFLVFALWWR